MNPPPPSKINQLIQKHFPWGQDGFPSVPLDQSASNLESCAKTWIENRLTELGFSSAAIALHARVRDVVDEVEASLPPGETGRLFHRPDFSHLVKSAESVLDKMARDWESEGGVAPRIGFDNFHIEMEDLARFRIVLNFLSDVSDVCCKLEEPYKCTPQERGNLSQTQRVLYDEFALVDHCLRNLINLGPDKRKSGERCCKGIFYPRSNPKLKVEVQIQTMIQEAWDKKDHFLIYEPKRRGEIVDEQHGIEIYAVSELLYMADLTFDRLLIAIRGRRGGAA